MLVAPLLVAERGRGHGAGRHHCPEPGLVVVACPPVRLTSCWGARANVGGSGPLARRCRRQLYFDFSLAP